MLEKAGVEINVWGDIFGELEELFTCGDAGGVVNAYVGGAGRGDRDYGAEDFGSIAAAVLSSKQADYRDSVVSKSKLTELACTCIAVGFIAVHLVGRFLGSDLRPIGGVGPRCGRFPVLALPGSSCGTVLALSIDGLVLAVVGGSRGPDLRFGPGLVQNAVELVSGSPVPGGSQGPRRVVRPRKAAVAVFVRVRGRVGETGVGKDQVS